MTATTSGSATPPPASSGTSTSSALVSSYTDQLKDLRSRTDLTAKVLAGAATTAAAALGVTKLPKLFQQPPGNVWWEFGILLLGLVLTAATVLVVASRLWNVGQPIPAHSNPMRMQELGKLSDEERGIVEAVYADAAASYGVAKLLAYEARGNRLHRVADWTQPVAEPITTRTQNLRDAANAIAADVAVAQARATYLVARKRTANVFTDGNALVLYVLFAVGLLTTGFAASYLTARTTQPNTHFAIAKDCGDLGTALKSAGLTIKPGAPGLSDCNKVTTKQ